MYAMKYMSKSLCVKKDAVVNVLREVELLKLLEHPFLVNLWFTFQVSYPIAEVQFCCTQEAIHDFLRRSNQCLSQI